MNIYDDKWNKISEDKDLANKLFEMFK